MDRLEQRQHYCKRRCRKCRKTVSVCAGDTDLFSTKVALRSLIGSLWTFYAPLSLSPDKAGLVLGIDHRSTLFDNFLKFLTPIKFGARRDQLSQQNSRRKSCLDPLFGNCQAWKQQNLANSIAISHHRRRPRRRWPNQFGGIEVCNLVGRW